MEIFCTYCSKEKDELIDYLPAIHMYKSKRIRKVNEAAKLLGYPMFILSGKYGLIPAEKKIRYYDHLLLNNEVKVLVEKKVVKRLKIKKINKIYFFLNSSDKNIRPYVNAISIACKLTNTKLIRLEIDIGEVENAVVNGYREIWYASLKANQQMTISKDLSGKSFDNIFKKHPNDGMLYYERAEAFEFLGEPDKAKSDYELALFYFPNPKWKKVAYEGLKRIQNSSGAHKKYGPPEPRWNNFHKVNSYAYIPHDIRILVLSALERYEEEIRLATGELRIGLEMIVGNLSKKYKTIDQYNFRKINFPSKIDNLKKVGCGGYELYKLMNDCWEMMSDIIHPSKYLIIPEKDYEKSLDSFMRILELCEREKYLTLK